MNAPGLFWSKTISIYDSHRWNMPTQMRLNSLVAQQTRVCYLSVTLSRPWKIICWKKFAHILKTNSHLEIRTFRANRNHGHFCRGWPARWTNLLLLHRNSLLSCSLELGKLKQPCQGLYSPRAQKQTSSEKRKRKKKKATQSFDKQFVFPL